MLNVKAMDMKIFLKELFICNDETIINLSLIGQCLMFVYGWLQVNECALSSG